MASQNQPRAPRQRPGADSFPHARKTPAGPPVKGSPAGVDVTQSGEESVTRPSDIPQGVFTLIFTPDTVGVKTKGKTMEMKVVAGSKYRTTRGGLLLVRRIDGDQVYYDRLTHGGNPTFVDHRAPRELFEAMVVGEQR